MPAQVSGLPARATKSGRGLVRAARTVVAVICAAVAVAAVDTPEAATARRFAAIKGNPSLLLAFLREMPKGGDLHNHLSGSIYAESYLRWAAEDKLCLSATTMSIVVFNNGTPGGMSASDVLQNAALYN